MEKVENGQEGQGIKLFGKTIVFQVKEEPLKSTSHDNNDIGEEPSMEKRPDKIIPCPRCKSMETKFCYFNNYNVNQPRHFCKGCQRYWTAGGALRNVPIGAGRRKAKLPGLPGGFSDNVVFDHATGAYHVVGFVDGLAVEEYWAQHNQQQFVVAGRGGGTGGVCGGFGPDFPAKRRRNMPYGQTNC